MKKFKQEEEVVEVAVAPMAKFSDITVGVSPFTQEGPHKKRQMTRVFIRKGNEVIAERTIPGKWNKEQALTEFQRFPDRFTPRNIALTDLRAIAALRPAA